MIVALHTTQDKRLVLAVCDAKLIGSVITEGNRQLDLSSPFYRGNPMGVSRVKQLMKQSYIINCVGHAAVRCALQAQVITRDNVAHVKRIPYTQALFLDNG